MTKQEKDGILSAVLNVPTPLKRVKMKPATKFGAVLERLKLRKPEYRMLELGDLTMATNWRLTAISNAMDFETGEQGAVDSVMKMIHDNTYAMATYVATAVQNENKPAPKHLVQTIAEQFTNEELHLTVKEVYRRLDVQSFFASSALVRSLDLM